MGRLGALDRQLQPFVPPLRPLSLTYSPRNVPDVNLDLQLRLLEPDSESLRRGATAACSPHCSHLQLTDQDVQLGLDRRRRRDQGHVARRDGGEGVWNLDRSWLTAVDPCASGGCWTLDSNGSVPEQARITLTFQAATDFALGLIKISSDGRAFLLADRETFKVAYPE